MNNTTKRIVALLAAIAAGTVPSGQVDAQPTVEAALTHQSRTAQVPLYLSGRRSIAVVKIGDHPPSPVVFDTGTSGNALDADYAAALKLEKDPDVEVEVVDGSTGKSFMAWQAKLPRATLGGVEMSEKVATVYPYKERDVVGIFGPSSFAGRLVLLEIGKGRLLLRDKQPSAMPKRPGTPYLGTGSGGSLPAIAVELPGLTVPALLDSGNTSPLLLPRELADKLPIDGPLKVSGQAHSVGGVQDVYEARLKGNIRIGPVLLENPLVKFAGIHANVGLPIIRQLTILLDPAEEKSWIVQSSALAAVELDAFAGKYGIRALRAEGSTLIYQRDGRPSYPLRYMGGDLFSLDETGDLLQFWRDGGRIAGFDLINANGTITPVPRTP